MLERTSFAKAVCEMASDGFFERVYELVRQVPEGRVVSYGQIATMLGDPRQARVVGWAMRDSPADVPWHRVVNSKGQVSTRNLSGGFNTQRALLEDEGVEFSPSGRIDLDMYGWRARPSGPSRGEG